MSKKQFVVIGLGRFGSSIATTLYSLGNDVLVIDKNEDFICIIKLMNGNVFGEEVLGSKGNNTGEDLII